MGARSTGIPSLAGIMTLTDDLWALVRLSDTLLSRRYNAQLVLYEFTSSRKIIILLYSCVTHWSVQILFLRQIDLFSYILEHDPGVYPFIFCGYMVPILCVILVSDAAFITMIIFSNTIFINAGVVRNVVMTGYVKPEVQMQIVYFVWNRI